MQYQADRLPAARRPVALGFDVPDYPRFQAAMAGGRCDVLLLDCGPDGDCPSFRRERADFLIAVTRKMVAENDHLSMARGMSRESLARDFQRIREEYVEVLSHPLDDRSHTRVLLHRRLLESMQPNAAAPPGF